MKHCLAVIRIGAYIGVFGMFVVIGACGHILFFMSQARLLKWIAFFCAMVGSRNLSDLQYPNSH